MAAAKMTYLERLSKELVLAIDWAAAEYKYLEDLKAELKKVEAEKDIKKELKELRKAAKILHYVARAERRAYEFEEEVGRELEKVLAKLEGGNLSVDLITGFRQFISQFKIEEEQLVKLASFYEGTLVKELDQARALEKLREHIAAEDPQKAEEIHSSFLHILQGFEHQVDEAERWVEGLEATLKEGKKLIGWIVAEKIRDRSTQEPRKTDWLGKGISSLEDITFPAKSYPQIVIFLANHHDDLSYILRKAGRWERSWWPRDSDNLSKRLVQISEAGLMVEPYWGDVMRLLRSSDLSPQPVFDVLILVYNAKIIDEITWPVIIKYLLTQKKLRGRAYYYVVRDIFIPLFPFYKRRILELREIIGWSDALAPLQGSAQQLITLLADCITPITWPSILEFMETIMTSRKKTSQLSTVMQGADSRIKTFLLYLILVRPRQALDILSTYSVLNILEIAHSKELDLLVSLAKPLLLKERNSFMLAAVLTPLNALKPRERAVLLSALERSVKGFSNQDMISFFAKAEGIPGFQVLEHSFVELSYLFFLLVNEPGIKDDKLQAKLQKMRKNAGKVLGLARKKWDDLSDMEKKLLRSGILAITELFFEPVLKMATTTIFDKVQQKLTVEFQVDYIPHIEEKTRNPSFQNALRLFKRIVSEKMYDDILPLAKELIRQYLLGNTYPLTKNILECYPWTLAENQAWLKTHVKNKWWLKGFKLTRSLSQNEEKDNHAERIEHHLREANALFEKLEIHLPQVNLQEADKAYLKIKDNPKIDQAILSDLKTQVLALRKLQAGQSFSKASRATIEPEFNPLEVLQMGNYVAGSCLATDGVNYWSTIVNASEVNKRVLWAKDEAGNIIGRMLIAIDEDNKIVAFPIYYATDQQLTAIFHEYLIQLVEKCGFGLNGKPEKVKRIFGTDWYTDGEVNIIEQAGSGN